VSGQTATRKLEDRIGQVLCGIAASASKFACDLRLLQHLKEVEEPFEKKQIGSSAMPYKRNPMRSERINSLARFVLGLMPSSYQTTATQWMERTLDDSAHRRLTISQGLLAVDAILVLFKNVASGLVVNPKMIEVRLLQELPFMAAEVLLMEGVKRGGDRQDLHESFRVASLEAGRRIKQEGRSNELLSLLAADPAWRMNEAELKAMLDSRRFTGRAGEQVRAFLEKEVAIALTDHRAAEAAEVRV
jgi:adenylosuccinate lyase